jgi:hypothetical protein
VSAGGGRARAERWKFFTLTIACHEGHRPWIAAVIAGSKSFAAIGQWAGDAGPGVLAALGAERGQAEEFTYRRAFALVSADVLDRVLGAWLHTRAARAGGRVVIAIDGKTVRGAKSRAGKPPNLVAVGPDEDWRLRAIQRLVAADGAGDPEPARQPARHPQPRPGGWAVAHGSGDSGLGARTWWLSAGYGSCTPKYAIYRL